MADQQQLLTLHGQLLAGDLRAASRIVELTITPLVAIVTADVAGLHDQQDVEQTCYDALLRYLEQPSNYDPQRAQLLTYLAAIAKGKAKTLRRSQSRRDRHEAEFADVEAFKHAIDARDEDTMLRHIELGRVRDRYGDRLFKEPGDVEVFDLMLSGENSLSVYARAIGLIDNDDGRTEAAKRLERMRGRIRRIGERAGE